MFQVSENRRGREVGERRNGVGGGGRKKGGREGGDKQTECATHAVCVR